MWITEDGVAHTVAPPRWQTVVKVNLRALSPEAIAALAQDVEDLHDALYERIATASVRSGPEGDLPPTAFRVPTLTGGDDLKNWLTTAVPEEWQLDVLDALELALGSEQETIRYHVREDQPRYWRVVSWMRWVAPAVLIVNIVLLVRDPSVVTVLNVVTMGCMSFVFFLMSLQQVVVDGEGIRRPFKREIAWSNVASVQRPGRFDSVVMVMLPDGRAVPTGLPTRYAEAIAELGEKAVVERPA